MRVVDGYDLPLAIPLRPPHRLVPLGGHPFLVAWIELWRVTSARLAAAQTPTSAKAALMC